jgi:CspA family cold shock protein
MPTGTVKWFNDQKGYGFIKQEGVAEDIFVHHTAIKMEGYRTLEPGQAVEFQIKKDERGLKAVNVVCLKLDENPSGEQAPSPAVS